MRMMITPEERERANDLVGTSVQDLQSSLTHYKTLQDKKIIGIALMICRRRGEKTKVKVLQAKFNQLEKTALYVGVQLELFP